MKKILLTLSIAVASYFSYAQNTFPTNGDAGIGTDYKLKIGYGLALPSYIKPVWNDNSNTGLQIHTFAGGADITAMSFGPTTGNVGIGISNPPSVGNYGVLALNGRSPSQGGYFSMMMNGSEVGAVVANTQFNFQTASGLITQFYTGSTPTLQISSSGNVGIGTTVPGYKTDIFNSDATPYSATVANATLRVYNPSATDNAFSGVEFAGQNGSSEYGSTRIGSVMRSGYSADFIIQQRNGGNYQENLRVTSNGNVLIGKTSQTNTVYKLDINGSVRANEVVVNTTGADFVFEPNYKLPRLSEVKTYIDQNHHLPEIPSAAEMQKNGMSVGELNTKLLQKVEELTLYLIEQQKQIEDLKKLVIANHKQ